MSAEQGATMHNENLPLEGSACRFRPLAREQTRTCCWKLDKAAEATGGVTWSGVTRDAGRGERLLGRPGWMEVVGVHLEGKRRKINQAGFFPSRGGGEAQHRDMDILLDRGQEG